MWSCAAVIQNKRNNTSSYDTREHRREHIGKIELMDVSAAVSSEIL
jgi:hypothetical protein